MSVIASVYYCIVVSGQLKSGKRLSWHWTVMPNLKKDLPGIAKVTWGICTLMVYLWPNCLKNELKNYRGVMFHGNEKWCKFEEESTCCFKNGIMNLVNFHASTWKSQNLYSDRVLMSKM